MCGRVVGLAEMVLYALVLFMHVCRGFFVGCIVFVLVHNNNSYYIYLFCLFCFYSAVVLSCKALWSTLLLTRAVEIKLTVTSGATRGSVSCLRML